MNEIDKITTCNKSVDGKHIWGSIYNGKVFKCVACELFLDNREEDIKKVVDWTTPYANKEEKNKERNKNGKVWCGICDNNSTYREFDDKLIWDKPFWEKKLEERSKKKLKEIRERELRNIKIMELYKNGKTMAEIADKFKIADQTVLNILRKFPNFDRSEIVKENYRKGIFKTLKIPDGIEKYNAFQNSHPIKHCAVCNKLMNKVRPSEYKTSVNCSEKCHRIYMEIKKRLNHEEKRKVLSLEMAEYIKKNKNIPYSYHKVKPGQTGMPEGLTSYSRYLYYLSGIRNARKVAIKRIEMTKINELEDVKHE